MTDSTPAPLPPVSAETAHRAAIATAATLDSLVTDGRLHPTDHVQCTRVMATWATRLDMGRVTPRQYVAAMAHVIAAAMTPVPMTPAAR